MIRKVIARGVIACFTFTGLYNAAAWLGAHLPIEAGGAIFVGYFIALIAALFTLAEGI